MMKTFALTLLVTILVSTANADQSPITRIHTPNAPNPVGPYSQAISIDLEKTKNLIFLGGQVAINPKTGKLLEEDIHIATNQILDNIGVILKASNSDWKYVVRMEVFLKDFKDWAAMNEEYVKRFPDAIFPARHSIGVNMDNRIEISCTAIVPKG